jgi:hypothetical protein
MLQTLLEPLMRVAKAHSRGKEEYAHAVVGRARIAERGPGAPIHCPTVGIAFGLSGVPVTIAASPGRNRMLLHSRHEGQPRST